jgi:hypothetical protein
MSRPQHFNVTRMGICICDSVRCERAVKLIYGGKMGAELELDFFYS